MQPFAGQGRIFLLRHGETDWNRARRVMGRRPIPLSESGREQLGSLVAHMQGLGVSSIRTSPMVRAQETAEIVSRALGGLAIEVDPGLAEVDYASWEGLGFKDLLDDPAYHAFHRDPLQTRVPGGGETLDEVRTRVLESAARALAEVETGAPLLISHGDPLRLLLVSCLALDPLQFRRLRIDNGALSAVDFTGEWSEVKFLNMRPDLSEMLDAELDGARALRAAKKREGESK